LFKDSNVRFYEGNTLPSNIVHNRPLETVWTIVPCFILLAIAVPSFTLLYQMDEVIDIGMTIKVLGNQWHWRYEHTNLFSNYGLDQTMWLDTEGRDWDMDPRLLATFGYNVRIPIKTNVRLLITSLDVLHSWALPAAGIKVDACPGRLNEVFIRLEKTCHLFGQCSEICGVNHAYMPIHVQGVYPRNIHVGNYNFFKHQTEGSFRKWLMLFFYEQGFEK
jgi:cytochrome c oxidase subunit 2